MPLRPAPISPHGPDHISGPNAKTKMPWIRTISISEATGRLARSYEAAVARAGRVFGIVRAQSLAPAVLDASLGLYQKIMYAPEGLSRRQREMVATIVSRANDCHY